MTTMSEHNSVITWLQKRVEQAKSGLEILRPGEDDPFLRGKISALNEAIKGLKNWKHHED